MGALEDRHDVTLVDRRELAVTGVTHVDRYHRQEVVVATSMGTLVVSGDDLSIEHLSLEEGRLVIKGHISGLTYPEHPGGPSGKPGLWRRLWR